MGIPRITPYPLPQPSALPENRVSWSLAPARAVLLIHDMQEYFLDYYDASASPAREMVAHIDQLRTRCAALGIPVVYSVQPAEQTPEERGLLTDMWGPGLVAKPHKQAVVSALAPRAGDVTLTKWRYSAFQRTDLRELLRRWGRDQLIICGVYAHIGCLMTAGEAFMSDVQPFLVSDATADFDREKHLMAIEWVAQRCGVALSTGDALAALAEQAPTQTATPVETGQASASGISLERLRSDIAEILEEPAEDIADDDNLLDLGLDSIRLMSLVERWRAQGAELSFVELAERPSIADWWTILSAPMPLAADAVASARAEAGTAPQAEER
ncbi:isochorismatase family protein [Haliangium ochraceum]|uniref:isochorismatase n=1 Tax=Haliangium ochraceum (strain DSM 14365 / JCM 11303 / SMP-2) TaxID=502025 RepID=D0LFW3_HALO1|nr:isochorismatase family protein [Haliangium ochraceum]ACY14565.1 Isochorismatase [Haliangium ochraceum DSM 14365]